MLNCPPAPPRPLRHRLQRLLVVVMAMAAVLATLPPAAAQSPANARPIPEPPPPPPGFELDPALEPQVTIRKRGEDTVEEYRLGGKLYMLKVTPPGGRPYYLIDEKGDGKFARQEAHDSGIRPPMWVIHSF